MQLKVETLKDADYKLIQSMKGDVYPTTPIEFTDYLKNQSSVCITQQLTGFHMTRAPPQTDHNYI